MCCHSKHLFILICPENIIQYFLELYIEQFLFSIFSGEIDPHENDFERSIRDI